MSQRDFLRAFDADAFAGFLEAGLGDTATYTDPDAAEPVACEVLVDRSLRDYGDDPAAVNTRYTTVALQLAQVAPQRGGTIVVGAESFLLDDEIHRDESISRWLVRHG